MLTVRELLERLELRALAGEESLELPVRWVHISEVLDPTPWLSGGELLLTTGLQLDTPERQQELILRLSDHQLAGLGFGTGIVHDSVPSPLVAAAQERGFPLFEVPYELPFIAITEAAFTHLVNEQYAVLRQALTAQERLERIVLAERGIGALAGALATLIGGAVALLDAHGRTLAQHEFRRTLPAPSWELIREEVRARRSGPRAFIPPVPEGEQALALPVLAEGPGRVPQAWIVAIKDVGALSDFDRLTLHQAVTIVALELLRGRVAGETERRLGGDVLDGVVSGELAGTELIRRLAPFGLEDRVAALVLSASSAAEPGTERPEDRLRACLAEEALPGLVAPFGSFICALVPGLDDETMFSLADAIARRLEAPVGVGRARPSADARRSFHEARCAVEALMMSASVNRGDPVAARAATYKDLGSFQLLLSLQDDDALRLFCDSVLAPIEASDERTGGELISSLEAFIEENGQWERAARRLYCHRHTLRYRIKRVEELSGRSLSSARDRIEFWLALRGRELIAPAEACPAAGPRAAAMAKAPA